MNMAHDQGTPAPSVGAALVTALQASRLDADDPRVVKFLFAWHENGRKEFGQSSLKYDEYAVKTSKNRRKYIACDRGAHNRSGVFLIDRDTGMVFNIKAYGVPKNYIGTLDALTVEFEKATAEGRTLRQ